MIEWYRVCFDPRPTRKRFENGRAFEEWLDAHVSIEHRPAGFIILNWGTSPNTMGISLWNIIIPTKDSEGREIDVVGYFTDNNWAIDDYDIVLMEKHYGGEEKVIPAP